MSKSTSHVRTLDNNYFSQTARAEATFVAWKRLVVRANADYNYYKGITDTFLEERLICNALLGVKLFRNRLGEVSVGVNDLLDQNGTTFRRTVTGTTLRNVTNLGVGRYVSFQFTLALRLFRRQSNAVMDALQRQIIRSQGGRAPVSGIHFLRTDCAIEAEIAILHRITALFRPT